MLKIRFNHEQDAKKQKTKRKDNNNNEQSKAPINDIIFKFYFGEKIYHRMKRLILQTERRQNIN